MVPPRIQALVIGTPLLLLCVSIAHAEGDDAGVLRQEVGELKQTVQRLDARVKSLEQQLSGRRESSSQDAPGAPTPVSGAPADTGHDAGIRNRWRKLTYGMTVEQVEALLGRPQKTMDLSPKTVWYYSYPDIGNGSVVLTQDGGVVDWQPPPFNAWW